MWDDGRRARMVLETLLVFLDNSIDSFSCPKQEWCATVKFATTVPSYALGSQQQRRHLSNSIKQTKRYVSSIAIAS